jgi:hypothetical protein
MEVDIESWRVVVEHWRAQGRDLRHLEVPPELASLLGVPLEVTKERRRDDDEEGDDDMTRAAATDDTEYRGSAKGEPKWKKRREFDGDDCGYQGCTRKADGYVVGTRSTKEGKSGRIWFGPACLKCVRKWHDTLVPLTLAQLAQQRKGASDLATVLDLEVGEVRRRLEAAGIDENGNTIGGAPPAAPEAPQSTALVPANGHAAAPPADPNGPQPFTVLVKVPFDAITAIVTEMGQTLVNLAPFEIMSQEQMNYASSYLQRLKGLANQIELHRKEIAKPFQLQVKKIKQYFDPADKALSEVEALLKRKILEAYERARLAQAASFQQAETAIAQGDTTGAAIATQQAVAADMTLAPGISTRSTIKWEIVDPSKLPAWAWSPDPQKIQQAVDMGHRQIDGVRIWEEPILAARAVS